MIIAERSILMIQLYLKTMNGYKMNINIKRPKINVPKKF